MSLITSLSRFARSPQGKRLTRQAMTIAKDPKTKQKLAEVRRNFAQKQRPR
jgi:hypothetical protein